MMDGDVQNRRQVKDLIQKTLHIDPETEKGSDNQSGYSNKVSSIQTITRAHSLSVYNEEEKNLTEESITFNSSKNIEPPESSQAPRYTSQSKRESQSSSSRPARSRARRKVKQPGELISNKLVSAKSLSSQKSLRKNKSITGLNQPYQPSRKSSYHQQKPSEVGSFLDKSITEDNQSESESSSSSDDKIIRSNNRKRTKQTIHGRRNGLMTKYTDLYHADSPLYMGSHQTYLDRFYRSEALNQPQAQQINPTARRRGVRFDMSDVRQFYKAAPDVNIELQMLFGRKRHTNIKNLVFSQPIAFRFADEGEVEEESEVEFLTQRQFDLYNYEKFAMKEKFLNTIMQYQYIKASNQRQQQVLYAEDPDQLIPSEKNQLEAKQKEKGRKRDKLLALRNFQSPVKMGGKPQRSFSNIDRRLVEEKFKKGTVGVTNEDKRWKTRSSSQQTATYESVRTLYNKLSTHLLPQGRFQ